METVEMDLLQAQIGSLATDVSRLEAKVSAGGGGGGGGGEAAILNVIELQDETIVGTTVVNMSKNITSLMMEIVRPSAKIHNMIYLAEYFIAHSDDIETDLEISGLFTYNNDGTTTSYSGKHNVFVANVAYSLTGGSFDTLSAVAPSSPQYALIIDLDTGAMVYAPRID